MSSPWEAIVSDLMAPTARRARPGMKPSGGRPTPAISRGHPFSAERNSICCRKERAIADRRLYAVSFESSQPYPAEWLWLVAGERHDDGWVAVGGAGGAGPAPQRDRPWVNLAGWWGEGRFYARGEVLSGPEVAGVRAISADGIVM
jgi:hypothetical protein